LKAADTETLIRKRNLLCSGGLGPRRVFGPHELFAGQSKEFFTTLTELAADADAAQPEC